MDVLARVVLHVDAGDADAAHPAVGLNIQITLLANGQLKLRNLIAGGQIRIKIIFPGENGTPVHRAVGGQAHQGSVVHCLAVGHGQGPRHAGADFADVGVGGLPKGGGAGTEQLGGRGQLHVHFQADDDFIRGHKYPYSSSGATPRGCVLVRPRGGLRGSLSG